jgi:hypothetical protein
MSTKPSTTFACTPEADPTYRRSVPAAPPCRFETEAAVAARIGASPSLDDTENDRDLGEHPDDRTDATGG